MQAGIPRVCSIVFIKHSLANVSVSYCVSSYCIVDDIKDLIHIFNLAICFMSHVVF